MAIGYQDKAEKTSRGKTLNMSSPTKATASEVTTVQKISNQLQYMYESITSIETRLSGIYETLLGPQDKQPIELAKDSGDKIGVLNAFLKTINYLNHRLKEIDIEIMKLLKEVS